MIGISHNKERSFNPSISQLIPVACHYDQHTLLTKNGELIQVVKVFGLVEAKNVTVQNDVRDVIRGAFEENLKDPDFAIYMHVMRDKTGIPESGVFRSSFALSVEQQWRLVNKYDEELLNTLYITIVHRGLKNVPFLADIFMSTLSGGISSPHLKLLDKCSRKLNAFVEEFAAKVEMYGTRVLGVITDHETKKPVSELLSFFYKIVHLYDKNIFLEEYDASEQLANLNIDYKFDSMVLSGDDAPERHAFILTIKYPYNVEHTISDKILQFSQKMMLTETMMLVPEAEASQQFKMHQKVYEASRSDYLISALNLNQILYASNDAKKKMFCQQQVSIVLYDTDEIILKYKMEQFYRVIGEIGVSIIKEDVNMATVFFSQIPGNFKYLSRLSYNIVQYGCNFSLIQYSKRGSYNGSKWGPPVTIIRSINGMPFFFNFHYKDNGNTLIYGVNGEEVKTMSRFILSQATRLDIRHVFINVEHDRSELIQSFSEDLCSKIIIDSIEDSPIQVDILDIKNNFDNSKELFASTLVGDILHSSDPVTDGIKALQILNPVISAEDPQQRAALLEQFKAQGGDNAPTIVLKLIEFFNSDVYRYLFSRQNLPNFLEKRIVNIYIRSAVQHIPILKLLVGMCTIKIKDQLNDEPTIISFNNANFLFEFEYTATNLENWLKILERKNAVAVLNITKKSVIESDVFEACIENIATKILVSDRLADKRTQRALMLDDQEFTRFKSYDKSHHAFMIKQGEASIFCLLNTSQYPELHKMIGVI